MVTSAGVMDGNPVAGVKSRAGYVVLLVAALFGCAIVFASFVRLPSPDGVYYDPYVGSVGDVYLVFENGRCLLRTTESTDLISTYSKSESGWVCRSVRGGNAKFNFTATILGIRTHGASNQEPDTFRFRRAFAWLPKSWTWIRLHFS